MPNGKAYNVYFKQFSAELDAEEIVMYNKLNEHYFTAHSQDILEYSGDTLMLRRGDKWRVKLSTPHWISIKSEQTLLEKGNDRTANTDSVNVESPVLFQ